MKKFLSLVFILFISPIQSSFASDDDNWGISSNSQYNQQHKQASEAIWDAEMQSYIESEYGSSESSYYNNRGNIDTYSENIGGDSFNSYGY